jgi:hypothetical protein
MSHIRFGAGAVGAKAGAASRYGFGSTITMRFRHRLRNAGFIFYKCSSTVLYSVRYSFISEI